MSSTLKDQAVRAKPSDVMLEGSDGIGGSKPDLAQQKVSVASGNLSEFTLCYHDTWQAIHNSGNCGGLHQGPWRGEYYEAIYESSSGR